MALADELTSQNVLWFAAARRPTVLPVDDQRREYKRAFASTLLGWRVGHGSQAALAKVAHTSEATYRRWENPDEPHLPDAFELAEIARHVDQDPADLVFPEQLNSREWALTRKAARSAARGATRAQRDADKPS